MSSLSDLAFDMEVDVAGTPGLRMDECVLHAHLTEHELRQHEGPDGASRAQLFAEEEQRHLVVAAAERTSVNINAIVTGDGRRQRGGGMDSLECVVEALSRYDGAYAHEHSCPLECARDRAGNCERARGETTGKK
jgi:hypothetical protein